MGTITLVFRACDGRPAHVARRRVDWPGVPREGDGIGVELQPEDSGEYPAESITWDWEGNVWVSLGRQQLTEHTREIYDARNDEADSALAWWAMHLGRSGWDVDAYPWPMPE
jgi:hypothetical protein